jgi:hypothetical protein
MKLLKLVLIAAFMLVTLTFIFAIYLGGYWENLPLLERISGPMRFRQFVCNPIPETVYNLRGGYSGFPQGQIVTHFEFKAELPKSCLGEGWLVLPEEKRNELAFPLNDDGAEMLWFEYQGRHAKRYIAINNKSKRGYLYIP